MTLLMSRDASVFAVFDSSKPEAREVHALLIHKLVMKSGWEAKHVTKLEKIDKDLNQPLTGAFPNYCDGKCGNF